MHLLKYFNKLSLRPKNGKELRGLILDLAIRGRLTEEWRRENPEAESTSILLERIRDEQQKLIKEKKIRKEKSLSPVEQDEFPFQLPKHWRWTRIGNIGEVYNGNSVSKSKKESKYNHVEEGYTYLGTKDIGYGFEEFNYDTGVVIPFDEPKFKIAKKGTVLICSEGGSAGKKCGITNENICFGNKLYAINPFVPIEPTYILSLYLSKSFQVAFTERLTGIIGGISKNNFKDIPFPLPPLQEQKAIVQIVNQLMEEVDQLEADTTERVKLRQDFVQSSLHQLTTENSQQAWADLQPHFKSFFDTEESIEKLKEAILQLAVKGKLTNKWREENPDVEPASVLLERIKEEKVRLIKEKKVKKEKPLPEITEDEIPFELPENWIWCRFGEIVKFMAYGTSRKTNSDDNGVPVLRMGNITSDGKLVLDNLKYINKDSDELPKLYLENGDLVFNRTNSYALVGKSAVYREGEQKYTLASYLIKVSPFIQHLEPDYLNNYIVSKECRQNQIEPQITAQTNQANFSGSKLKNILLPLPPALEQKVIVNKINDLINYCDQLNTEIKNSEVLNKYFIQSSIREVMMQTEII